MVKDFPKGFLVCFHCNQNGHQKAECLQLTQRSAQTPGPVTLHVTNGRPEKADTPRARGRAFQLTAEEVLATLEVVVVMYLFIHVVIMIRLCFYCA